MIPLLLEQPVKLFFLWLTVQLVVTVYWRMKRNLQSVKAFWIFFLMLPVLESVCLYVVTPREQIQQLCHDLADHVQKNDAESIAETIDDSFEASGYEKDELVLRIEDAVEKYNLSDMDLQRIEVQFPPDQKNSADDTAIAEFDATVVITSSERQYEPILSRWRLTFIRREHINQQAVWKITHINVLPRPFSPIRSLRQCLQ